MLMNTCIVVMVVTLDGACRKWEGLSDQSDSGLGSGTGTGTGTDTGTGTGGSDTGAGGGVSEGIPPAEGAADTTMEAVVASTSEAQELAIKIRVVQSSSSSLDPADAKRAGGLSDQQASIGCAHQILRPD